MVSDLSVTYLGLELRSPVVVGACPLTIQPETVRQLVSAGAGAIVLPSMLQEQVIYRLMKTRDPIGAIEQSGYQPQQDKYNGGAEAYLETIVRLKETSAVPVIASLNGTSAGSWLDYAAEIEAAGADALELNLQSAVSERLETSDQVEARLCQMVAHVSEKVDLPIAAKISQRYTNVASMAAQVRDSGANGIVLFTHSPQWDVSTDRMHWTIRWELSPEDSLGGTLEGVVRIRGTDESLSIAASGGVCTSEDAIKAMIAGADIVMVTSQFYREGPDAIRNIVDGIERYLDISPFQTLHDFQLARPQATCGSQRIVRLEYVDPLTRSDTYFDPAQPASNDTGDAYGHKASG